MSSMAGAVDVSLCVPIGVSVANGYGRCRHDNYRAHVCIPEVTVQENGRRLKPASGREEIFTGGLP
jgi:hypothetical protein